MILFIKSEIDSKSFWTFIFKYYNTCIEGCSLAFSLSDHSVYWEGQIKFISLSVKDEILVELNHCKTF